MLKSFQMRSEESGVFISQCSPFMAKVLSAARRDNEHPALWPATLRTGPEPQILTGSVYWDGKCW